jgi:hypothetical protein
MSIYYTGIGSRTIPLILSNLFTNLSSYLESHNFILRSGGAGGTDLSFESGIKDKNNCRIYLPRKLFNKNESQLYLGNINPKLESDARDIARSIHPNPYALRGFSLLAHTRNAFQVLGDDLNSPSDFLVCYTENGESKGGSRTAIELAKKNNIPVFNFGNKVDIDNFYLFMSTKYNLDISEVINQSLNKDQ